jgi:hypothetical protein
MSDLTFITLFDRLGEPALFLIKRGQLAGKALRDLAAQSVVELGEQKQLAKYRNSVTAVTPFLQTPLTEHLAAKAWTAFGQARAECAVALAHVMPDLLKIVLGVGRGHPRTALPL